MKEWDIKSSKKVRWDFTYFWKLIDMQGAKYWEVKRKGTVFRHRCDALTHINPYLYPN